MRCVAICPSIQKLRYPWMSSELITLKKCSELYFLAFVCIFHRSKLCESPSLPRDTELQARPPNLAASPTSQQPGCWEVGLAARLGGRACSSVSRGRDGDSRSLLSIIVHRGRVVGNRIRSNMCRRIGLEDVQRYLNFTMPRGSLNITYIYIYIIPCLW